MFDTVWKMVRWTVLGLAALTVAYVAAVTDGDLFSVLAAGWCCGAACVGVWVLPSTDEEMEEVAEAGGLLWAYVSSMWRSDG